MAHQILDSSPTTYTQFEVHKYNSDNQTVPFTHGGTWDTMSLTILSPSFSEGHYNVINHTVFFIQDARLNVINNVRSHFLSGEVFHCKWDVDTTSSSQPPTSQPSSSQAPSCVAPNQSGHVTFVAEQVSHHPPGSCVLFVCMSCCLFIHNCL